MPRLRLECRSGAVHVIPGQSFEVQARLWNFRPIAIDIEATRLRVPPDYQAQPDSEGELGPPAMHGAVTETAYGQRSAAGCAQLSLLAGRATRTVRLPLAAGAILLESVPPLGSRPSAKFRWKDSAS